MNERIQIMNEITEKLNINKLDGLKKEVESDLEKTIKLKKEVSNKNTLIVNKLKSIEEKLNRVKMNNRVLTSNSALKGFFEDCKEKTQNLKKTSEEIKHELNYVIKEDEQSFILKELLDPRMIEGEMIDKQRNFTVSLESLKTKIAKNFKEVEKLSTLLY